MLPLVEGQSHEKRRETMRALPEVGVSSTLTQGNVFGKQQEQALADMEEQLADLQQAQARKRARVNDTYPCEEKL